MSKHLIQAARSSYRSGRSAERAVFGMSTAFAATIGAGRLLNYVRERSRAAPRLRSVGRRLLHTPASDQVRVHHFVPGIGLAFATGGAAILRREGGLEGRLSFPFGAGVALTSDELALLVKEGDRYWSSESFALAQCAAAALVSAALAANFARRGLADASGGDTRSRTESTP